MGTALVTLPDGRKAKITYETADQLDAAVNDLTGKAPAVAAPAAPAAPPESALHAVSRNVDDFGRGLTENIAQLGTGTAGMIAGGLAGIGTYGAKKLGLTDANEGDVVQAVQDALTYQPKSEAGKTINKPIAYVGEKVNEGLQGIGDFEQRVTEPFVGTDVSNVIGAMGQAGPVGAMAAADPVVRSMRPKTPTPKPRAITGDMTHEQAHAAAVETLDAHNIPTATSQRTTGGVSRAFGQSARRGADVFLGKDPLIKEQKLAYTRELLENAGAKPGVTRATPDVMSDLANQVDKDYTALHKIPTVVDSKMVRDLNGLAQEAQALPDAQRAPIINLINHIKENTKLSPEGVAELRTRIEANRTAKLRMEDAKDRAADRAYEEAHAKGEELPEPELTGPLDGETFPEPPPVPKARETAVAKRARQRSEAKAAEAEEARIEAELAKTPVKEHPPGLLEGKTNQYVRTALVNMGESNKLFAGKMKAIIDNAFERSATPAEAARMRRVRLQHGKVKDIENALGNDPEGIVEPGKMQAVLNNKKNRKRTKYEGGGDRTVIKLTNAMQKVTPEEIGNSGTPGRAIDTAKIAAVTTSHLLTLGGDMALAYGARKIASGRTLKHTVRGKLEAERAPPKLAPARRTALATVATETQEQKRRRLLAEAMRK